MTISATLGDLHLGRTLYGFDLTPATRAIMYRFFHLCLKRKADYAVQLGDIFDSPRPSPWLEKLLVQWSNEFERAKLSLYLMTGNHDVISKPGHISALDAIKAMTYRYVRVIDRPMAIPGDRLAMLRHSQHTALFLPFPSVATYLDPEDWRRSVLDALRDAKGYGRPIVAYSHLDVSGATWGAQDVILRGTDFAIPKEVRRCKMIRRIVAGHIHAPQKVGRVLIQGAAQRLRIDEAQHDRFFLFVRNGKPIPRGRVLARDAVRMLDLKVDASVASSLEIEGVDLRCESQDDLLTELTQLDVEGRAVRVQVWVNAKTVLNWGAIEKSLHERGALFVYPMTPQVKPEEAQGEVERLAIDPDKAARQFIRERIRGKKERTALLQSFRALREEAGV